MDTTIDGATLLNRAEKGGIDTSSIFEGFPKNTNFPPLSLLPAILFHNFICNFVSMAFSLFSVPFRSRVTIVVKEGIWVRVKPKVGG